jgi:2-polyprenyl-3-methyl-5-hydroxy-6-metoxy-1,4-benzoquinol methylase
MLASMIEMSQTQVFGHNHKSLQSWLQYSPDNFLHFLLSLLTPKEGELILDNGCGNGRFSVEMRKKGAYVIMLDVNRSLLKKAIRKARDEMLSQKVDFVLADMQSLPFRGDVFDKILCVHNLWYVPSYQTAVSEMLRTLKRNGQMLVDHLNLLNLHVFLTWVQYVASKISGRDPPPVFYRTPYKIQGPFSTFRITVFSVVIKQRKRFYVVKGINPFANRLIIKCSKTMRA